MGKSVAGKGIGAKPKDKIDEVDEIISGIGKRIRETRENLGLSQIYIVEKSGERIGQSAISEIERGTRGRSPNLAQVLWISNILGVPVETLIGLPYFGGGIAVNTTENKRALSIDPDFYKSLNLPANLPESSLVTYPVEGNSMLPTAGHGDAAVVNTTDKRIWEGLFAVKVGEVVAIKRLQPLPDGGIRLTADDKAYPPIDTTRDVIVGRVVLVLRRP